jgi:hypothetical protein
MPFWHLIYHPIAWSACPINKNQQKIGNVEGP